MTVEIRHLRAFLAIAEERSVTKAALRLHVSQPALSRTLAALETTVGTRLVDRSTHHLELTEAGARFETEAYEAVRVFEATLASASGADAPLRLGHSWSAGTYLSRMIRSWNDRQRPCAVAVVRSEDRTAGLTSGRVDLAITRGPIDGRRFRSVVLDDEPRVAVLPADHPLARRRRIRLADLVALPLVMTRVGITSPELWPLGARPSVASDAAHTVDDWLVAIASGVGFGVSGESTGVLHPHPDVVYRPLIDAPTAPVYLAWPKRGEHPATKEFVQVARGAIDRSA